MLRPVVRLRRRGRTPRPRRGAPARAPRAAPSPPPPRAASPNIPALARMQRREILRASQANRLHRIAQHQRGRASRAAAARIARSPWMARPGALRISMHFLPLDEEPAKTLGFPPACAASSPSSCTSSRRAANSTPSACVTAPGSSSVASKHCGGAKKLRDSCSVPSARSRSSRSACPQRLATPSRGSARSSPTVETPMLFRKSVSTPRLESASSSSALFLPFAPHRAARGVGRDGERRLEAELAQPGAQLRPQRLAGRRRSAGCPALPRAAPAAARAKP